MVCAVAVGQSLAVMVMRCWLCQGKARQRKVGYRKAVEVGHDELVFVKLRRVLAV